VIDVSGHITQHEESNGLEDRDDHNDCNNCKCRQHYEMQLVFILSKDIYVGA
jgi:hypothetical protein